VDVANIFEDFESVRIFLLAFLLTLPFAEHHMRAFAKALQQRNQLRIVRVERRE